MGEELYIYLSTFLMGLLGIWKAIPLGFALGGAPFWIYTATVVGASLAAFIIYFFGDWVRRIIRGKSGQKPSKQTGRARKLLEKYGIIGLGFLGTVLIGPNATLLVGLLLVQSTRKLLLWTIIGIFCWSFVLILLAEGGIQLFKSL